MSRYVATDWHGIKDISAQVLSYLKPEDELYFLGDAIDRGPDGMYIMLKLLQDPRITYLKGNHEDMLADVIFDYIEGRAGHMTQHWLGQGGQSTWKDLIKISDATLWRLRNKIINMPERIDIENNRGEHIILTHAGCDPWVDDEEARLFGLKHRYLWDRKHIHHSWDEFQQEEWKDTYVIHGHTPVLSRCFCGDEDVVLPGVSGNVVHYAGGHKICLDLFTVGTGRAVLFDLDTFEEIYFVTELEEKE
jgi:serine/threonine protein phosphatase 1